VKNIEYSIRNKKCKRNGKLKVGSCNWGVCGGVAVLFISFACPKETNQRKRPQQNQPQFFLRKIANTTLSEKLRFALLLDPCPQCIKHIQWWMMNVEYWILNIEGWRFGILGACEI
jgi:hypothetical protein